MCAGARRRRLGAELGKRLRECGAHLRHGAFRRWWSWEGLEHPRIAQVLQPLLFHRLLERYFGKSGGF